MREVCVCVSVCVCVYFFFLPEVRELIKDTFLQPKPGLHAHLTA
jgi:hypothetical protein